MSYSQTKHILVFGSTGTGKTTLVKHLSSEADLETSSRAIGVTMRMQEALTRHKDNDYRIIDTVGLNEAEKGSIPAAEALMNLMKLLKNTEEGLNLMIMVTNGKITKTTTDNYKLFIKTVTLSKVPVIIVQTHLDDEEDPSKWVDKNMHFFTNEGMDAAEIVGTALPKFNPSRDCDSKWADRTCKESTDRVWVAIERYASPTPVYYFYSGNFKKMLKKTWNAIAKLFRNYFNTWVVEEFEKAVQAFLEIGLKQASIFVLCLVVGF